jgi:hypothetical protein
MSGCGRIASVQGDWKIDEIGSLKVKVGRVKGILEDDLYTVPGLSSVGSKIRKSSYTQLATTANKEWLERRELCYTLEKLA